jgi:hypothetical protein
VELGHAPPPDPNAPGPFALADEGALVGLLEGAGFQDVTVTPVEVARRYERVEQFIEETLDVSPTFGQALARLDEAERQRVLEGVREGAAQFCDDQGRLLVPGLALVALASA